MAPEISEGTPSNNETNILNRFFCRIMQNGLNEMQHNEKAQNTHQKGNPNTYQNKNPFVWYTRLIDFYAVKFILNLEFCKGWAGGSEVEHFPHTEGVTGSNPVPPIFICLFADVAQLAEQLIRNQQVVSSTLTIGLSGG